MLLIIFLSLFAKLTLLAGDCDNGTQYVDNFDWTQVCINVITRFIKQELKLFLVLIQGVLRLVGITTGGDIVIKKVHIKL
jgi:hypothetical protein